MIGALRQQKKNYDGESSQECEIGGKRFKRSDTFKLHIESHEEVNCQERENHSEVLIRSDSFELQKHL